VYERRGAMLRVTRGWLFVAVIGLLWGKAEAAEPGFTNLLPNPSFEMGTSAPAGWVGFGFGDRRWEFHGRHDSRCISITADGRNAGWWYSSRMPLVEHNGLYRLSFYARSRSDASEAPVVVGLNICNEQIQVGPDWRRYEVFFRAPNYLPDAKVCFGQERLDGSVLFDDVALEPAVGIHRSRGRGAGLSLGDGESIVEGRYTAVHDPAGCGLSDRRFLDSYTSEYHCGRWVLDGYDEVVYHHTLSYLGIGLLDSTLVVSDRMRYLSGSMGMLGSRATSAWVENDPRAERGLLPRPL